MDSEKEDKYGMFLKMESFLDDKAAALAANSAFADILTELLANDNAITQADSTALRNLSGLTQIKHEKRTALETSILTVAAAARGYYTTNHDPYKKVIVILTPTEVKTEQDAELISIADKVHDVADPIKTLLTPWGVAAADVDALLTKVDEYRPTIVKRSREQDVSSVANKQVNKLFGDNDKLLADFDDHFAVYEFTNNSLFLEGRLARAIDNSGGNSGTEGYDVTTLTVPAGGSIIIPTDTTGPLPASLNIYARAINGSIIVCTVELPASPCTGGFELIQGVTFKGEIGGMGLDLSKSTLQFTNPGLTDVKVRAGVKMD